MQEDKKEKKNNMIIENVPSVEKMYNSRNRKG
jgi:hypothetical protein